MIKTSQIPDLVDALSLVGGRIDRMWEEYGATWFTGDGRMTTTPRSSISGASGTSSSTTAWQRAFPP